MSRTVQYLFAALVMSGMLSGCLEGPIGPQGEKGDPGDLGSKDAVTTVIVVAGSSYQASTSSTPQRWNMSYLVTDEKGNPLSTKRVDFEIIEGDATLSITSGLTSTERTTNNVYYTAGEINVTIYKGTLSTAKVKATVFGYNASVTTSIIFK